MAFIRFMNSGAGRALRILAGVTLIAAGLTLRGGWLVVGVIGLAPLAAGVIDVCVLAPLFHLPLLGRRMRHVAGERA